MLQESIKCFWYNPSYRNSVWSCVCTKTSIKSHSGPQSDFYHLQVDFRMRTICGMERVPASLLFDVVCARDVKSKPVFTRPVLWLTCTHCWFLLLLSVVSSLETGRKLTETQLGTSFHFAWRLGKWFIGAKRWLVGTFSKRDRLTTNTDRTE